MRLGSFRRGGMCTKEIDTIVKSNLAKDCGSNVNLSTTLIKLNYSL